MIFQLYIILKSKNINIKIYRNTPNNNGLTIEKFQLCYSLIKNVESSNRISKGNKKDDIQIFENVTDDEKNQTDNKNNFLNNEKKDNSNDSWFEYNSNIPKYLTEEVVDELEAGIIRQILTTIINYKSEYLNLNDNYNNIFRKLLFI